jgi:sec-independent protein translocase protein TatA
MFGLGLPELMVIFVIALVVFGPKKLPELGKSIGRAMAEFKKASQEFQESIQAEMKDVEKSAELEEIKKIGRLDFSADERKPQEAAHVEEKVTGRKPEQPEWMKSEEKKGNG